ncbi:MAG: DNRLRE domain-containing protein, partial [Defluviitaleaceae bacterium]|nr:DNRLRE domain-containing protein [Defluviitaleaceae bacterium]
MILVSLFVYYIATPVYVLAEEAQINEIFSEYTESNDFSVSPELKYSPLLGELEEKRGESVKHLRREDGAVEAVLYSAPVHYWSEDAWQQIDNTLIPDGSGGWRNTANDFKVSFADNFNSNALVRVEAAGKALSWSFEPNVNAWSTEALALIAQASDGVDFGSRGQEGDIRTLPAVDANANISNPANPSRQTDEERDDLLRFPLELNAEIEYSSAGGLSVRYVLSGKRLLEYITIAERLDAPIAYTMQLNMEGLHASSSESGMTLFLDKNNEIVLQMSAPVVYDAAGESGMAQGILLTRDGGGYEYVLIPDQAWLQAPERVYPVVVDPDISLPFEGNITDTHLCATHKNKPCNTDPTYKESSLRVGTSSHNNTHGLVQIDNLPELKSGDVIVNAYLRLSKTNSGTDISGKRVDLYRVIEPWDHTTANWDNFNPTTGTNVDKSTVWSIALAATNELSVNFFDITKLIRYWYEGIYPNYGVSIHTDGGELRYASSDYGDPSFKSHPTFSIIYYNSTGLEGRFSYHSQSAGRAGTGSVNDFSGNLTWTHADAGIANGLMPISVSHVFNTNDKDIDIGYGLGWRVNYAQSLQKVTLQNRDAPVVYYELIDGDGTRHYYKQKSSNSNEYINELDNNSKLTVSTSEDKITIEDKGGNRMEFATSTDKTQARLTKILDANGNATELAYTPDSDYGATLKLATVTESLVGQAPETRQRLAFSYETINASELLTAVTPQIQSAADLWQANPGGLPVLYDYDANDRLTRIHYADDNTNSATHDSDNTDSTFTYNSANCLTQAMNGADDYNLNYSYTTGTSVTPDRVSQVTEQSGSAPGQHLSFDYGWNVTTVTDKQGRQTIYQFNNAGQAVSVRDPQGNAVFAAYNSAPQTTTQLSAVSKMQNSVINLLVNPSFERPASDPSPGWTTRVGAEWSTTAAHTGRYQMQLTATTSADAYAAQSISGLTPGEKYTFSAYFANGADNAYVEVLDGGTRLSKSDPVLTNGTTEWSRGVTTFTAPGSGTVDVRIFLPKPASGTAVVYADDAQLERSAAPNRVNLIENGDMDTSARWEYYKKNAATDGFVIDSHPSRPTDLSPNVYHIVGETNSKRIYQTVAEKGSFGQKGDTYSFGAWMRSTAPAMNNSGNGTVNVIKITVYFYTVSGTTKTLRNSVDAFFGADTEDWQYACGVAIASGTYNTIEVALCANYSAGDTYFDGLQLYREEFSQGYKYDAKGNLEKYTSLLKKSDDFKYDKNDNLTESKDADGKITNYTYYAANVTGNPSDNIHLTKDVTSAEGIKTGYEYNAAGQTTTTKLGSGSNTISGSTAYDSDTGLSTSQTDARGNTVTTQFDTDTRQVTQVTGPSVNGTQSTVTNTYDTPQNLLRQTKLQQSGLGDVDYGYDSKGRLNAITRASTTYKHEFDEWGRVTAVKIGNVAMSTSEYYDGTETATVNGETVTQPEGALKKTTFANGYYLKYLYDSYGRLIEVKDNNGTKERYTFDGEGNVYAKYDGKTNQTTYYEYDHAGKCVASTTKDSSGTTVASYLYQYNDLNQLSRLSCSVAGISFSTTYTYDGDGKAKTTLVSSGKTLTNSYDNLGRLTKKSWNFATPYNTALQYYRADGSIETNATTPTGAQTTLLATYKNGSDNAYEYEYDNNG